MKKEFNRLKKIKTLLILEEAKESSSNTLTRATVGTAMEQLEEEFELSLKATTPKALYNKPYKKLTRDERNEYSQIKRLIGRYQCEE